MMILKTAKGVASAAICALTVAGSYAIAGADVKSFHGADYSEDYSGRDHIRSCDKESDSNETHGEFDFNNIGGGNGTIGDKDGNNGICGETPVNQLITRHKTCEQNLLAWDCDNWASTTK